VDFFMVIDPESGGFIADQRTLSLADANQW